MKKGQALIKLDSEVIEAQYEVARARAESKGRIMAAKAERDRQKDHYGMLSSLRSRGSVNSAELKREYAILQAAEGNYVAAQEDTRIDGLEAMRIRAELNRRILKTPIDGYVATITRDLAEPVGFRGDREEESFLVRIVQLATLKATAFLPHQAARSIEIGDTLTLTSSDLDDTWETPATVEFVSPLIDPATGTVEVRVTVDNSDLRYRSGAPARLVVKLPVELSAKE